MEDSDGSLHVFTTTAGSVLSANLLVGRLFNLIWRILFHRILLQANRLYWFNLDSIPAANKSGTSSVTLKLYDGTDSSQVAGERLLETTIHSIGPLMVLMCRSRCLLKHLRLLIQVPTAISYRTWENVDNDTLTFSYDDNGQPGLDLRIAKFFAGQGEAEGADLTGYITSGDYFFDVGFTNLEFLDVNDNSFTSVSGGFKVAAAPEIVAYIDDVETTEAGELATITVNLSKAASSDVTVNYSTTDGTAVAGSDYTSASGTLTIAAELTQEQ